MSSQPRVCVCACFFSFRVVRSRPQPDDVFTAGCKYLIEYQGELIEPEKGNVRSILVYYVDAEVLVAVDDKTPPMRLQVLWRDHIASFAPQMEQAALDPELLTQMPDILGGLSRTSSKRARIEEAPPAEEPAPKQSRPGPETAPLEVAPNTRSDDEYMMAAFELDAAAFLTYFATEHPEVHGRYEQLCQAHGNLEEFHASPLVFILANKPECCTHVAKRFIDARPATMESDAAPAASSTGGEARVEDDLCRGRSRSPRQQGEVTPARTAMRRSQTKLKMWKKGKTLMKRLFDVPQNQLMSDEEFEACQKFMDDTLMVSDWPRDNFQRHSEFLQMVRKSYKGSTELGHNVPWRILKAKHERDRVLPGFKEMDGKCHVAFFAIDSLAQRTRETEWAEFTDSFVSSIA